MLSMQSMQIQCRLSARASQLRWCQFYCAPLGNSFALVVLCFSLLFSALLCFAVRARVRSKWDQLLSKRRELRGAVRFVSFRFVWRQAEWRKFTSTGLAAAAAAAL